MSGMRGEPRNERRVKVRTKIQFPDTNKRVTSHIFLNKNWSFDDIQTKLNSKFPEKFPILLRVSRII